MRWMFRVIWMAWDIAKAATSGLKYDGVLSVICSWVLNVIFVTSNLSDIVINTLYHITKDVCYMWHTLVSIHLILLPPLIIFLNAEMLL